MATVDAASIIAQGAEARLYTGTYRGQSCLVKERFCKTYRHPDLDRQLTRERIRAEAKALTRCANAGIAVPQLFGSDLDERCIYMEHLSQLVTVKQYVRELADSGDAEKRLRRVGQRIGRVVGQLHSNNIIHGDLTTSNMLLDRTLHDDDETPEADAPPIVMIDFGLSHYSTPAEDKGVDLYVLERALLSTHSASMPGLFDAVLEAYRESNADGQKVVITKFEAVRARGRKRTMIG